MMHDTLIREKFSEDLFFMVMSSPLRTRIELLARRHGLDAGQIRCRVLALAEHLAAGAAPSQAIRPRTTSPAAAV